MPRFSVTFRFDTIADADRQVTEIRFMVQAATAVDAVTVARNCLGSLWSVAHDELPVPDGVSTYKH